MKHSTAGDPTEPIIMSQSSNICSVCVYNKMTRPFAVLPLENRHEIALKTARRRNLYSSKDA